MLSSYDWSMIFQTPNRLHEMKIYHTQKYYQHLFLLQNCFISNFVGRSDHGSTNYLVPHPRSSSTKNHPPRSSHIQSKKKGCTSAHCTAVRVVCLVPVSTTFALRYRYDTVLRYRTRTVPVPHYRNVHAISLCFTPKYLYSVLLTILFHVLN